MAGVLRRGVRSGVILGHEISGLVVETGNDVTGLREGDRVVSILTEACGHCDRCSTGREHRCRDGEGIGHGRDGGFAEYAALSEHSLVKTPEGVDPVGAALLACPMGVALQAVQETAHVVPGETVVVTGAGGGLGSHAVQAAAALGARVLAVTSSSEKENALRDLGAAEVLGDGGLDFAELVMAMTGDEGSQVVIDTVGSALFPSTLGSLAQFGRLVLLGEIQGQSVSLNPAEVIFRDARVLGASGVSTSNRRSSGPDGAGGQTAARGGPGTALGASGEAYRLVSERKPTGRIVLLPDAGGFQ